MKREKFSAIKEAFTQAVDSIGAPESMRKFGEKAADMIRLRTRLGSGVQRDGAEKDRLKPLAASTKKKRAQSKLSQFTTPNRSNLTETGQLLDSVEPKNPTQRKVTVGPQGPRDDGKTNEEVAKYVSEARPFNHLSKTEIKRIGDDIKRAIRQEIKARLTKNR